MRLDILMLALLIAGCKKPVAPEVAEPIREVVDLPIPVVPEIAPRATAPEVREERLHRVYFAFDSAELAGDDLSILTDNAEILKRHKMLRIEAQGHCDERGTVDYNLALGQRRAETVKRYLVALGVDASRIDTISYGEERRVSTSSGEAGWAKDRRVEIRVVARMPGDEKVIGTVDEHGGLLSAR